MKLHRIALLALGLAVLGCEKKDEAAGKAAEAAKKAQAAAEKAKAGADKAAEAAEKAGMEGAADKAKQAAGAAEKAGEAAGKAAEMAKEAGGEAAPVAISEEAEKVFKNRCATCHGATGMGDGPAASALNPKPRKYSDSAWQKSVTDDYLAKVIVEGGASVGKSPLMAANPDLKDKPEVVKDLVAKIRSFAK